MQDCHLQVEQNEAETRWPTFHRQHFKFIFLYENQYIMTQILVKLIPKGLVDN